MCGIVGYIGHRDAYPIIVKGLQRLEYRGYDSAGIALYDGTEINLSKTKGKVEDLKSKSNHRFHWKVIWELAIPVGRHMVFPMM